MSWFRRFYRYAYNPPIHSDPYLKLFPTSVRIGNGIATGGETKVTARCLMENGDCICEFVMSKDGSKWKIKSFSGNLEEMTVPPEKREEFEPEVYYFF